MKRRRFSSTLIISEKFGSVHARALISQVKIYLTYSFASDREGEQCG